MSSGRARMSDAELDAVLAQPSVVDGAVVRRLIAELRETRNQLMDAQGGLVEALELAEDMIGYVPDYYREKWSHDEDLATLRATVAALGPASASPLP